MAIVPHTRVVSPNPSWQTAASDEWSAVTAPCMVCRDIVVDPAVCARCNRMGHPECLGAEILAGHVFCGGRISTAIAEYSSFRDAQSREDWRRQVALQVSSWKARAVQLIGASSAVGVAVGGAVGMAAGAAAALAQGAFRGVVSAALSPRAILPPPDQLDPVAPASPAASGLLRRSR